MGYKTKLTDRLSESHGPSHSGPHFSITAICIARDRAILESNPEPIRIYEQKVKEGIEKVEEG